MRELFARFPEVVMIDATHGTNLSKYNVFSIMAHDAFGKGHPRAVQALQSGVESHQMHFDRQGFRRDQRAEKNFPGRDVAVVSVSRVEISARADSVKGLWVQRMAEAATKRIDQLAGVRKDRAAVLATARVHAPYYRCRDW
ncbi:hypothetical protein ON010_g16473 [Phytophthora cinnamomi]|nr:hypothetical protein ON010_g16473 [Phytophthora cinnamomi]